MVDVSLVPEAAWREARRRAEVIRPLVESRLWRARLEGVSGAVLIALGVRLAAARR